MRNARIFVEKKQGFNVEAISLKETLNHNFNLNIKELRLLNVYDIFNVDEVLLERAKKASWQNQLLTIFSKTFH